MSDPRECDLDGGPGVFYNLILAVTCYCFFHILLVMQNSLDTMGEGIPYNHKCQLRVEGHLGGWLPPSETLHLTKSMFFLTTAAVHVTVLT